LIAIIFGLQKPKQGTTQLIISQSNDLFFLHIPSTNNYSAIINPVILFELGEAFFSRNSIDEALFSQTNKRDLYYKESRVLSQLLLAIGEGNTFESLSMSLQVLQALLATQVSLASSTISPKKMSEVQIKEVAEELIQQHIEGNNMPTIDTIAESLGISTSKFKTLAKDHFGESFYQYFLSLKFEHSTKLLQRHSVGETAEKLGFKVVSKFIEGFKARYKQTPFKYKQNQK
jgi:AraC-like DNA-binding protein